MLGFGDVGFQKMMGALTFTVSDYKNGVDLKFDTAFQVKVFLIIVVLSDALYLIMSNAVVLTMVLFFLFNGLL